MNDDTIFGRAPGLSGDDTKHTKLARWLQSVLQEDALDVAPQSVINEHESQLELLLTDNYHLSFYQQLPDFIMALLTGDPLATAHYTPLLYHLVECRACHNSYLDLYDSMRAAVQPQSPRLVLGQGTRTLSATPHRMLAHLCQSLISQAEVLLRQARHDHVDNDAAARSLLQLALRVSSHIIQSATRRQALQDLVRVATLFDGPGVPREEDPHTHSYTPVAATGSARRGKVLRRADSALRENNHENAMINLQSHALEGSIVQKGEILELHLQDLDLSLRGHYVAISILLGSLIEPVSWIGGDPRAIRSAAPVDENGTLVTPLGRTELSLTNPEERNLLEAMFMLIEIRALD